MDPTRLPRAPNLAPLVFTAFVLSTFLTVALVWSMSR
jgi:hypothetical protein